MAIVTENIYSDLWMMSLPVTYDDEYISNVNMDGFGIMYLEFFVEIQDDSGILIDTGETDRFGRPIPISLGVLSENDEYISNIEYGNIGIISFEFDVNNYDWESFIIDTSNINVYESEPEYIINMNNNAYDENLEIYINNEIWEYSNETDRYGRPIGFPSKRTNSEFNINLKSKEGYSFELIPIKHIVSGFMPGDETIYEYSGDELQQEYNYSIDSNMTISYDNLNIIPYDTPSVENYPFTHLYNINGDELTQLSKYRFDMIRELINLGSGQQGSVMVPSDVDPGQYIVGLYRFPYLNIEEVEKTEIVLGEEFTDVEAIPITEHISGINLGSIFISSDFANTIGFSNVTIDLYVPYFNTINLDVDEVLYSTIQLILNVNLMTGMGTLNIYNSRTNTVIATVESQIGEKIPYEIKDLNINIGGGVLETDFNIPYVEIKSLVPNNTANMVELNPVNLNTMYDYLKDGEVILNTSATENEQKMIKDYISKGIFIRKH